MRDRPHLVVITGMSGAGRSQAAKYLEDLGYGVVDNLPPALIKEVVGHVDLEDRPHARLAVVVDTRRGLFFDELGDAVLAMEGSGVQTTVLFLDADDETLAQRYSENRRPHPVEAPTLGDSIALERKALEDLRGQADIVLDTTDRNVHEFHSVLKEAFSGEAPERPMRVAVSSFGFKWGLPRELDLLFDVRFLPNPYWEAQLRELTGNDQLVRDYVLGSDDAQVFLDQVDQLLEFLVPRFVAEGKAYLTIGLGCTGGRHRSVALARVLADRLREHGIEVTLRHRDVDR